MPSAARKVGFERGQKVGQLQGQRQGIQSGANAALGGFTDWQPGSFYIVKFGTGTGGVPFVIDSRKQMSSDERYAICANNPGDICTAPITRADSASHSGAHLPIAGCGMKSPSPARPGR